MNSANANERFRLIATNPKLIKRFWSKVNYDQDVSKCWEWTGTIGVNKYGTFGSSIGLTGAKYSAHRFSYFLSTGNLIPNGMIIMHKCDNTICCNPTHLSLGTPKENTADMVNKNRHWCLKKTHCKRGHEFTEENTYNYRNTRRCRICGRRANKNHRAFQKSKPINQQ